MVMLREGHVGIGLLLFIPIGIGLAISKAWGLFAVALWATAMGSVTPDMDTRTWLLKHRGWTHTIWFVAATFIVTTAGAFAAVTWGLPLLSFLPQFIIADIGLSAVVVFGSGFAFGTFTHLVGDGITPRGIRPFQPTAPKDVLNVTVSDRKYCYDIVNANNRLANTLVLAAGMVSISALLFFTAFA